MECSCSTACEGGEGGGGGGRGEGSGGVYIWSYFSITLYNYVKGQVPTLFNDTLHYTHSLRYTTADTKPALLSHSLSSLLVLFHFPVSQCCQASHRTVRTLKHNTEQSTLHHARISKQTSDYTKQCTHMYLS